jgi:hypothetical protein
MNWCPSSVLWWASPNRKPVPEVSDRGNGAMKAAVMADKTRRLAPASDDAIPASPEVGSVMDIKSKSS